MKFMVDHLTVCFFFFLLFIFLLNITSGAGTLAGTHWERQASQLELQVAQTQGMEFGKLVLKLTSTASTYA